MHIKALMAFAAFLLVTALAPVVIQLFEATMRHLWDNFNTISGQFWNSLLLYTFVEIYLFPVNFVFGHLPLVPLLSEGQDEQGRIFFYERSSSLLEIGLSWDQCSCRLAGGLSTQSQPLWVIIGPHTKQLHVYTLWIWDNKEPSLQLIFVI